jgi:hypothetical protein
MNAKVANVIAVELGLLIVILSWLAFSNFSRLKPPASTEDLLAPENSLALIRPLPQQLNYPPKPVPYAAVPQPHSATGLPPAVQSNQALQYGALDYYDQVANSTPYTVVDNTPAQTAPYYDSYYDPYYSGGYAQPTIPYPDDYYYLPNDYGYYPSPGQIIVVNTTLARERARNCFNHPPMQAGPSRRAPGGNGNFRPPNRRPGGRDLHSPGGLIASRGGGNGAAVVGPRRSGGGGGATAGGGGRKGGTRGGGGAHSARAGTGSASR